MNAHSMDKTWQKGKEENIWSLNDEDQVRVFTFGLSSTGV